MYILAATFLLGHVEERDCLEHLQGSEEDFFTFCFSNDFATLELRLFSMQSA